MTADRGFGFSAELNHVEAGRMPDTALSVYESFDLPQACGGVPPEPRTVLFDDDVESGVNGWTADGLWHLSTRRAESGSNLMSLK